MAATPTARLGLNKQAYQDPSWHTSLDAGFDNADARLLKISSDHGNEPDPNGLVAGDYVGQRYLDETANPPRWWVCSTAGIAASAVWELLGTTGVYTSVAKNGNQNLETILADYQTRLAALEALDLTAPVLPDYIFGLELGYVGPTEFSINVGEAGAWDGSRIITLPGSWTKTTGSWVAGDGNGALSSSLTLSSHTTYHVFIMYKASGTVTDIGMDTSLSAANLISDHGFEKFHHIMDICTERGSTQIIEFHQCGDWVTWEDGELHDEIEGIGGGSTFTVTLDGGLAGFSNGNMGTPLGVPVMALIDFYIQSSGGSGTLYGCRMTPYSATWTEPSRPPNNQPPSNLPCDTNSRLLMLVDASRRIKGHFEDLVGANYFYASVNSFQHPRGRNYPYVET